MAMPSPHLHPHPPPSSIPHCSSSSILFLSRVLKVNSTLTHLLLAGNNIGPEGAEAIAAGISSNAALTRLDLSHNSVGAQGLASMLVALRANAVLTALDLRWNCIEYSDQMGDTLTAVLQKNKTLVQLGLSGSTNSEEYTKLHLNGRLF